MRDHIFVKDKKNLFIVILFIYLFVYSKCLTMEGHKDAKILMSEKPLIALLF